MNKEDFDYINSIFEKELNNDLINIYLSIANNLISFLEFIIKECPNLPKKEYNINIDNNFYYAFNYIKNKHPRYYQELLRMQLNGELHIANHISENATCDSYSGEIWLGFNQNILDDLNLVHEFFHHINLIPIGRLTNEHILITRNLFGEAISIVAQLDFVKSLIDSNLKEDAVKFEFDYINDCIECAKKIRIELFLIDIYKKYGKLSDDLIKLHILNCKDVDLQNLVVEGYEKVLNDIAGWGSNFKTPFYLKYVFGITLGYYLADLLEQNSENWKIIYDINDNFYYLSIEDFLNKLGININEDLIKNIFWKHYLILKDYYDLTQK